MNTFICNDLKVTCGLIFKVSNFKKIYNVQKQTYFIFLLSIVVVPLYCLLFYNQWA